MAMNYNKSVFMPFNFILVTVATLLFPGLLYLRNAFFEGKSMVLTPLEFIGKWMHIISWILIGI